MRSSRMASAILALALGIPLLAGCGATSAKASSATSCDSGTSQERVAVVAVVGHGKVVDSCPLFHGSEIPAETAMHKSGIEYAIQHFSFGDAVCQIDHDPTAYTQCLASGSPYWALFVWTKNGPWKSAQTGISDIELHPGQAIGWRLAAPTGTPKAPPRPPHLKAG